LIYFPRIKELNSCLGEDGIFRKELDSTDLDSIRQANNELPIRFWEYDDYTVSLNVNLKQEFVFLKIVNVID
jgi:hypothetical protein